MLWTCRLTRRHTLRCDRCNAFQDDAYLSSAAARLIGQAHGWELNVVVLPCRSDATRLGDLCPQCVSRETQKGAA